MVAQRGEQRDPRRRPCCSHMALASSCRISSPSPSRNATSGEAERRRWMLLAWPPHARRFSARAARNRPTRGAAALYFLIERAETPRRLHAPCRGLSLSESGHSSLPSRLASPTGILAFSFFLTSTSSARAIAL